LADRHAQWITLYNSNLDTARPKSIPQLREELKLWEAEKVKSKKDKRAREKKIADPVKYAVRVLCFIPRLPSSLIFTSPRRKSRRTTLMHLFAGFDNGRNEHCQRTRNPNHSISCPHNACRQALRYSFHNLASSVSSENDAYTLDTIARLLVDNCRRSSAFAYLCTPMLSSPESIPNVFWSLWAL
jgi:hypothetical protein